MQATNRSANHGQISIGLNLCTESMSAKNESPSAKGNLTVYKLMAIVCALFLFCTAVSAQRFNAFVGYSHIGFGPNLYQGLQLDPISPPLRRSLNGWNASLEAKVLPILGIVADFSGHYGNGTIDLSCSQYTVPSCFASNANVGLYTFSAGPQVSLRLRKIEPYAHALFGADVLKISNVFGSFHETSFADVLGGGIDFLLIQGIAWRAEADVIQTRFSLSSGGVVTQNSQNSLRLSTGLMFRF